MDSDSESQDSDDGRRFRFETTRKDAVSAPQSRRKALVQSPQRSRRAERRSRSRNRGSRDEKPRHSKDDTSRKNRSPSDRETSVKHVAKERGSKVTKSCSRDSNSRRQHDKDSRGYRTKDSRSYDSRESRDSKDHTNNKHKNKSRDKHKKHSRDKSREKSGQILLPEDSAKKDEKKTNSDSVASAMEVDEVKPEKRKVIKRQRAEDNKKVNHNSVDVEIESNSSNSIAVSDIVANLTSPFVNTTVNPKKVKSYFDRVINKRTNDNDNSFYGPALPLSLEKKFFNAKDAEGGIGAKTEPYEQTVPNPEQKIIGPSLPKSLSSLSTEANNTCADVEQATEISDADEYDDKQEEREAFGPALPPYMETHKVIESTSPENDDLPGNDKDDTEACFEPRNNEEEEEEGEDNDIVGPLPADHPAVRDSYVQIQLEHRARQMKAKFKEKTSPERNKREEWMVELPPAHAVALGLSSAPRKFKATAGPDLSDRSSWTDTPADKLRKQREKEENRFVRSEESNKKSKKCKYEEKEAIDEPVEVKCESLLDMHLKTLKRKKKKLEKEARELGITTRRPFDRDIDLQVNRLNDARKKKIFEKASRLNDRFTSGKI